MVIRGACWFSKLGSTAHSKVLLEHRGPVGLRLVTDMVSRQADNQTRFLIKLMHARPAGRALHGLSESVEQAS